jgi:hypothetical protein
MTLVEDIHLRNIPTIQKGTQYLKAIFLTNWNSINHVISEIKLKLERYTNVHGL